MRNPLDKLQNALECLCLKSPAAVMTSYETMTRPIAVMEILKQLAFTIGFVAVFAAVMMYGAIFIGHRSDLMGPYPRSGITEVIYGGIFAIGAGLMLLSQL